MRDKMRPGLKELMPYQAPYIEEGIKLDANENTSPVSEALRKHMMKWVMTMPINYYPDTQNLKLRQALAKSENIQVEQVICGVGSDQLIDYLLRVFVTSKDYVLSPDPSFSMYHFATQLNGGQFLKVPLKEDFSYDVNTILEKISVFNPKIIFICNPNNPTGTVLKKQEIEQIVQASTGIVVIDEAYAEFNQETMVELVHDYAHVIILRTFSKAYGLAGARIGYGIGSVALIEVLDAVCPPYTINSFSQEIAHYVVTHKEDFRQTIEAIIQEREKMRDALIALGFEVAPSATNFLWIKACFPIDEVLMAQQIYVKMFRYNSQSYCRLSIGTKEQNKRVINVLKEYGLKGGTVDASSTY